VTTLFGGTIDRVRDVAAGGAHSMALRADGRAWAWGHGAYGQRGYGGVGTTPFPFTVINAAGTDALQWITALTAANNHSLAVAIE
jgi:alpha-tubulin suppressor-like RCC1 family protein